MENINKNTEVDNTDKKLNISDVMHSIILKMVYEAYISGIKYNKKNGDSNTEEDLYKRDLDFQNMYNAMLDKYCA